MNIDNEARAADADLDLAAPAAPQEGPKINRGQRQHGLLSDLRDNVAIILWKFSDDMVPLYGVHARQQIRCDAEEIETTDGLEGAPYPYRRGDELADKRQPVSFYLSDDVQLPPPGERVVLPPTLRAMCVKGANGRAILVRTTGRLASWTPPRGGKSGYGLIIAHAREGSKLKVFYRAESLLGPDGTPHASNITPMVNQAVCFTARPGWGPRARGPTAERVTSGTGGAVLTVEDVMADQE